MLSAMGLMYIFKEPWVLFSPLLVLSKDYLSSKYYFLVLERCGYRRGIKFSQQAQQNGGYRNHSTTGLAEKEGSSVS